MRRMPIHALRPGFLSAIDVYDGMGGMLVRGEQALTSDIILSLEEQGYQFLTVLSETEIIANDDIFSAGQNHISPIQKAKNILFKIDNLLGEREGEKIRLARVIEIVYEKYDLAGVLSAGGLQPTFVANTLKLCRQLLEKPIFCYYTPEMKSAVGFLAKHVGKVAVNVANLGRWLGMRDIHIERLVRTWLMCDLGYFYIDPRLFAMGATGLNEKQEQLTRLHPLASYAITGLIPRVRPLIIPEAILQHHERSDSSGYPKGLVGSAVLDRNFISTPGRINQKRIHPAADIIAVAETFAYLTTDLPEKRALSDEDALRVISHMGGKRLNRDVTQVLAAHVPPYPEGSNVRIMNGPREGSVGTVTHVFADQVRRPKIELIREAGGEEISPPLEVDLRRVQWSVRSINLDSNIDTGSIRSLLNF